MKRTLTLLFLCLLAASCDRQSTTDLGQFVNDGTVRLEIDGATVFRYTANVCQLAFNEGRAEFRAFTDTMLDYFVLTLDRIPETPGTRVNASLIWSSGSGEKERKNITLDAKRIKGDIIWLCDDSRRNAVVVRVLE